MAFGVTAQGFVKKRLSDIKLEIENSLRSTLGNSINLMSETVFANLVGVYADREMQLWELAEQIYFSQYPDSSEGVTLDNALSITGVTRIDAKKSLQISLHMFGTIGAVIPAGTQVSVENSPESTFTTKSQVTLVAGVDEVQHLAFSGIPASGQFRLQYSNELTIPIEWDDLAADIQSALNALNKLDGVVVTGDFTAGFDITFAGNSGKINHPLLEVVDNSLETVAPAAITITPTQTTAGVPQGISDAEAVEDGPIAAPAFSLNVIDTPVSGLDRVVNTTDAVVGRDIETDNEVRIRRRQAQAGLGAGTVEAIRSRLLLVEGVDTVIVFENDTDVVDGNGLPPHSFRAYVNGGADQAIWDAIWLYKPGGIYPDGTEVGTTVDSQGLVKTMRFSRPDIIEIFINVEVTTNADFPDDGEAAIRTALADYINGLQIGDDVVVYPKLISSLNSIVGIVDIEIGVDVTPSPALGTDDNIPIAINEVAKVVDPDTDIEVNIL
jgi:uncharacterized phage protein gp47/JayE